MEIRRRGAKRRAYTGYMPSLPRFAAARFAACFAASVLFAAWREAEVAENRGAA